MNTIIKQLIKKTESGKIKWQGKSEKVFEANLNNGVVRLKKGYLSYEIAIMGLSRNVYIDYLADTSSVEYSLLSDLYDIVRDKDYILFLPFKLQKEILN